MKCAALDEAKGQWLQVVPVKEWYSIQDVCTLLNVGGPSVYGAIKRGTMKGHRLNGVTHVSHDNLLAYLARRASTPTFDPSQLQIEEIIPAKEAATAAAGMVETPGTEEEVSLDFLED